jgi:hypothetical protein
MIAGPVRGLLGIEFAVVVPLPLTIMQPCARLDRPLYEANSCLLGRISIRRIEAVSPWEQVVDLNQACHSSTSR